MTLKTRLDTLESKIFRGKSEPILVGWPGTNIYPATGEEIAEARKTGNRVILRETLREYCARLIKDRSEKCIQEQ
ncbi:MAG: hypothetical protein H6Q66_2146 [Firmicutes bacterium]|nr:hypothetical protein [Bacillota bacterium]